METPPPLLDRDCVHDVNALNKVKNSFSFSIYFCPLRFSNSFIF